MRIRLLQIVISSLAVLSLLSTAAWACTCSHHEVTPEVTLAACPHHEGMQVVVENQAEGEVDTTNSLDNDPDCVCPVASSRLVAKSEALKLKKQTAAISLVDSLPLIATDATSRFAILFAKPHYLSDSFYDLAPKRGPPRS